MWSPPGHPAPIRTGADLRALRRELSRATGRRYGRRELAEDLAAIGAPRQPAALRQLEHARELPPDLGRALELLRAHVYAHGRPAAPPARPEDVRPRAWRLRQRRKRR